MVKKAAYVKMQRTELARLRKPEIVKLDLNSNCARIQQQVK